MLTLAEAAAFFRASAARVEPELSGVVESIAVLATSRAKSYIGHQQDDWEPLHEATIEGFVHAYGFYIPGKAELGFAPPDYQPLERTGEMGDSIEPLAEGLTGGVVSDDKVMLYQEMGTPNALYPIPPRPTLAKGLQESLPELREALEQVATSLLVPE